MIDTYIKLVKAHEKLLLVGFALVVFLLLGNKYLKYSASRATGKAEATQQVAAGAAQNSVDMAKLVESDQQKYQQLVASLSAQNQSLIVAIKTQNAQAASHQQADKVEPLPLVAQRWITLLNLQATDIQSVNGSLTVSEPGARTTVEQLELVPSLQADLKDAQTISQDKTQQIDGLNTVVSGLHEQVGALNVQITDDSKACKAQVAEVTAKARHSKLQWFERGLAIGGTIVAFILK